MNLLTTILLVLSAIVIMSCAILFLYIIMKAISKAHLTISKMESALSFHVKAQTDTNKHHEETILQIKELIKALFEFKDESKNQLADVRQLIMDQRADNALKSESCNAHKQQTDINTKHIRILHDNIKRVAEEVDVDITELSYGDN